MVAETEDTVDVIEEEDDTDVSELLPEFNSSCIVDKTRQASIRLAKCLDVCRAGLVCQDLVAPGAVLVDNTRAEVTAAVESTVPEDDGKWWCRKVTVGYDKTRHENATQDKARGKGQGAKTTSLQVLSDQSVGDVAELVGLVDCLVE